MNIFKRLFGKKQKPSRIPPPHTQLRFPTPRGISGNSLKDRSSQSEDEYYERRRRENQQTALDSIIQFQTPIYDDPTPASPSSDSHFGGYGGGDTGGGGASGSWDSGSSDSGSYDSGSSDSGGCDSGGSSD